MSTELPPRPLSLSPQPSNISDRRSPYFRTHTPLSSYESNHETVLRRERDSPTLAETHLICNEGSRDENFSEEHWHSEVLSFITPSAPKFLEVIKPCRVHPAVPFTLSVRVQSDPPASFLWGFNDRPVAQEPARFVVRTAINSTALIVQRPQEGVYSLAAKNPAGVSRIYGHVTLESPSAPTSPTPRMEIEKMDVMRWSGFTELSDGPIAFPTSRIIGSASGLSSPLSSSSRSTSRRSSAGGQRFPQKPVFLQVPSLTQSLTLADGQPLIANVCVMANPPADFQFFFNNFELRPSDVIAIRQPAPNAATLTHRRPPSGVYKIVAANAHGRATYAMRIQSNIVDGAANFRNRRAQRSEDESGSESTATGGTGTTATTGEQRRGFRGIRDDFPKPPTILTDLPPLLHVREDETLVLDVRAEAEPAASFLWLQNNFELKDGQPHVRIEAPERNASRLVVSRPVEGKYEVIAENPLGRCSRHTKVVIEYANQPERRPSLRPTPAFSRLLPAQLQPGAEGIEVEVRASEAGVFRWFADGQPVASGVITRSSAGLHHSALKFAAKPMAGVTYAVEFANSSGSIRSQCTIRGEEPKIPPIVPPKKYKLREVPAPIERLNKRETSGLTVDRRAEDFNETSELKKKEESYALLVKVSESLAEQLTARIMIDSLREAAHRLSLMVPSSEEEEEEDSISVIDMSQRLPPPNEEEARIGAEIAIHAPERANQTVEVLIAEEVFELLTFTISEDIEINALLFLNAKSSKKPAGTPAVIVDTKEATPLVLKPRPPPVPPRRNSAAKIKLVASGSDEAKESEAKIEATPQNGKKEKDRPLISSQEDVLQQSTTNSTSMFLEGEEQPREEAVLSSRSANPTTAALPPVSPQAKNKIRREVERQLNVEIADESAPSTHDSLAHSPDPDASESLQSASLGVSLAQNEFAFARDANELMNSEGSAANRSLMEDSGIFLRSTESDPSAAQKTAAMIVGGGIVDELLGSTSLMEAAREDAGRDESGTGETAAIGGTVSSTGPGEKEAGTPSEKPEEDGRTIKKQATTEGGESGIRETAATNPDDNSGEIPDDKAASGAGTAAAEKPVSSDLSASVWAELLAKVGENESRRSFSAADSSEIPLPLPVPSAGECTSSKRRDLRSKSRSPSPRRSKAGARSVRARAMDGLHHWYERNIGGKLRRIQERRSVSRTTPRSRSSQPAPFGQRDGRRNQSADENPDRSFFSHSSEQQQQQQSADYLSTRYYDSPFGPAQPNARAPGDRRASFLHASASEPVEYFYNEHAVASTETIRQFGQTDGAPPSPVRKYVDALFGLDDLIDWTAIDEGLRERRTAARSERKAAESPWDAAPPSPTGRLDDSIRRLVDREEASNRPEAPLPSKPQEAAEQPEEATRPGRLHGRVFPLTGANSPAPYLLRTNSTCRSSRVSDITQEWALLKEPLHGKSEAFFYPFERTQTDFRIREPKPPTPVAPPPPAVSPKADRLADGRPLIDRETQTTPQAPLFMIQQQQTTYLDGRLFPVDQQQQQRLVRLDGFDQQPMPPLQHHQSLQQPLQQQTLQQPPLQQQQLQQSLQPQPMQQQATPQLQQQPPLNERQFQTLPARRTQTEAADSQLIARTIREVENEAHDSRRRFHKTVSEDALRIERTIFEVSEELARRGPVSRAQAMASEELLRTRIAEAILNLNPTEELVRTPTYTPIEAEASRERSPQKERSPTKARSQPLAASREPPSPPPPPPHVEEEPEEEDPLEKVDILRDPINSLKSKLQRLEEKLIHDEERQIREELREINMRSADNRRAHERRDEVKRRSDGVARMTPLIVLARNKLASLDAAIERKAAASPTARRLHVRTATPPPFDNTRSIHRLLLNIAEEIGEMHELTKANGQIESVNLVVGVISRVCTAIDGILEAFQQEDELSEATTVSSAQSGVVEHVSVNLKRRPEAEETNTLLMFWSEADETSTLSTQLNARIDAPPQQSITRATVRVYEFAHVALRLKAAPRKRKEASRAEETPKMVEKPKQVEEQKPKEAQPKELEQKLQKVEEKPREAGEKQPLAVDVPQIQLVAPALSPRRSEVRTEVAVSLRHRAEHREADVALQREFDANARSSAQIAAPTASGDGDAQPAVLRRKNAAALRAAAPAQRPQPVRLDESLTRSQDDEQSCADDVPILFARRRSLLTPDTPRETAILSSDDEERSNLMVVNVRNACIETFKLKKHRRNYKVNAFVYPAVGARATANIVGDEVQVDVDVEPDETWRDSVVVLTSSWTMTEAFIPGNTADRAEQEDSVERDVMSEEISAFSSSNARMSISINARSMNDNVAALLEEVLWSDVSLTVPHELRIDHFSEGRNSGHFNVTVSENQDEAKSARSQYSSHRSSKNSLAISEQFSQQSVDVPTYIIKQGSIASITCELNAFVPNSAQIEWWCGRQHVTMNAFNSKYSRVRDDHLEVLVIQNVQPADSELYSITVDKEIYPVAYLIVEDTQSLKDAPSFASPPQTMFVMEGQTAILSCRSNPNAPTTWFYNDDVVEEDERHYFQQTPDGWNRVIIEQVNVDDAGAYYALSEETMTAISLVVEEMIAEKEVQVSNAETEDEELSDYLVPLLATATIACELDVTDRLEELIWQKNGRPIELGGQSKFEHVVNGPRHYLVIHQAEEADSGIYSVMINGLVFKVAQITIGDGFQMAGSRIKQISTSSICI